MHATARRRHACAGTNDAERKRKKSKKSKKKTTKTAENSTTLKPVPSTGNAPPHTFSVDDVVEKPSIQPNFKGKMVVGAGIHKLDDDDENTLVVLLDFLEPDRLQKYLEKASKVQRVQGKGLYNHMTPRYEVAYTTDGRPYNYGNKTRHTIEYPKHVRKLVKRMLRKIQKTFKAAGTSNAYTELSTGVDIEYGNDLALGGSIGAHSDDEMDWGMVAVFSLGQTRYFRVRAKETRKGTRKWYNIPLKHNSLVVMHGKTFQKKYTHQVDKLKPKDSVGTRLSLNVRFLKGA